MRIPTLLLAAFAILVTVHVEAAQTCPLGSKREGGSDKPFGRAQDKQGNLRLEVVTFPQDVQAGFKDLNKQALLYHPIEKPEGKTPLIVLLHGAGGTRKKDISSFKGNRDVKWVMTPANSKHVAKILVPHSRSLWHPGSLNKMLDYILKTNSGIDKDRIYCIGYSMGGKGTWEWAMTSPKRFAAIVPVAFIADLSKLKDMVDLPIWAMVGTGDRRRARGIPKMAKALKELGSTVVRTTIFEGANHASTAGKAWAQEGLLDWLFAQSRKKTNKKTDKKTKISSGDLVGDLGIWGQPLGIWGQPLKYKIRPAIPKGQVADYGNNTRRSDPPRRTKHCDAPLNTHG